MQKIKINEKSNFGIKHVLIIENIELNGLDSYSSIFSIVCIENIQRIRV